MPAGFTHVLTCFFFTTKSAQRRENTSKAPERTSTSAPDLPKYRTNEFVRDAFEVKITPYMLDAYASEFDEQVKAANAHRREVDALRLVNRNLAARVKALEEQLNQVNAEHVDLVKSVVMAKVRCVALA